MRKNKKQIQVFERKYIQVLCNINSFLKLSKKNVGERKYILVLCNINPFLELSKKYWQNHFEKVLKRKAVSEGHK